MKEVPSPTRPKGTKGHGHTDQGGDHLENMDRMLVDILGTKYSSYLTDPAKKLKYADLLMLHNWFPEGITPGTKTEPTGRSDEFEALVAADVRSVAEAIEQKTGRKYPEGVSYGSCSCVP